MARSGKKWPGTTRHACDTARMAVVGVGILLCGLVTLGGIVTVRHRLHYMRTLGELASAADGYEKMCGFDALLAAMGRIGRPVFLTELHRELTPDEHGVSFARLREAARRRGLGTRLARLTWNEIIQGGTPAVLWVNGNHFVAVDPAEGDHTHARGAALRVYSIGQPAQWWSRSRLEQIWNGESLLIRDRHRPGSTGQGPRVRWDACLHDFGFRDHNDPTIVTFAYENVGTGPLSVKIVKAGCSCAGATVREDPVSPGKRGTVAVSLDLQHKRGFFFTDVVVETSDPEQRICSLFVRGGVLSPRRCSCDAVYFGNVVAGDTVEKLFVVHDRGDQTLEVVRADVDVENTPGAACSVEATIRAIRLTPEAAEPAGALAMGAKPGDYVICLAVRTVPDCPPGMFAGTARIDTRRSDAMEVLRLPLSGAVVSDVTAEPAALLICESVEQASEASITLKSRLARPIEIADIRIEGGGSLGVHVVEESLQDGGLMVKLMFDGGRAAGGSVRQARVLFTLRDGAVVKVPVIIRMAE